MKKKLLFTMHSFGIGGIETAFINLINAIDKSQYDIDVLVQKKEGAFLDRIPKEVNVIDFGYKDSNTIFRKLINRLKLFIYSLKIKNKYDFAGCFCTYCFNSSYLARFGSKNNALWGHSNYFDLFNQNLNEVRQYFLNKNILSYKNIFMVYEKGAVDLKKAFPEIEDRISVCNNMLNVDELIQKKNEFEIDKPNKTLLVNIAMHTEEHKKISRIIRAAAKLKQQGYDFIVWLIGSGKNTNDYERLINENGLEECVELIGHKTNPYPYFRIADAHIISSDIEGFPVTIMEGLALKIPLITTNISDVETFISDKYGIVVEKNDDGIYKGMKKFLDEGYAINQPYDINEYNNRILNKIYETINE